MKIAFIGCGNMAQSLIGGLIANGTSGSDILVADPQTDSTTAAAEKWNVTVASSNRDAVTAATAVVLAVKPQQMKSVLSDITDALDNQLLISIAAGVLTSDMLNWANGAEKNIAIVRCMPNTPALIQQGATGLYADDTVTASQRKIAEDILQAAGQTAWVKEESQLDAITALSGSGPAYFFLMIEAMTDAAKELGLQHDLAVSFATQTALGAAQMVAQSAHQSDGNGNIDAARLRKNVTSPAGTTEAALNSFDKDQFRAVVLRAMQAANHRAFELGRELGD